MTALEILIEDTADRLENESTRGGEKARTYYTAAKLLRAFNDIFAPTWSDVEFAEQMRKDRKDDKRNGHPWNYDE